MKSKNGKHTHNVQIKLPNLIAHDVVNRQLFFICSVCAVVVSAFVVIYITFLVREATRELQSLETQQHQLEVEWRNLRLEQSALAEHSRIEKIAKQRLGMKYVMIEEEQVIEK